MSTYRITFRFDIGRKSVKVSARWLDWPADQDRPRLRPRALKVKESVL